MIRENYGQIRKKSNQFRENFMWESRNAEKERNRENIWNRSGNQSRKNRRTPMTRKSRT